MSRMAYIALFSETRYTRRRIKPEGLVVRARAIPLVWGQDCVGAASGFVKGGLGLVAEVVFDKHDLGDALLYPSPDLDGDYRIAAFGDVLVFLESCLLSITLVEFDLRPWENVQPLYVPSAWREHDALS